MRMTENGTEMRMTMMEKGNESAWMRMGEVSAFSVFGVTSVHEVTASSDQCAGYGATYYGAFRWFLFLVYLFRGLIEVDQLLFLCAFCSCCCLFLVTEYSE